MDHLLRRTVSVLLLSCSMTTGTASAQEPASGTPSAPESSRAAVDIGSAAPGAGSFVLPLEGGDVARAFDGPAEPWLPGHRGVDLGASSGATVTAPAAGTVAFAGVVAGKPVVSLDHPGGVRTTYEPVRATVREGDRVTAGAAIGQVAATHPGCPRQWCLHWGARMTEVPDSYFDPLTLVGAAAVPIVLKPL